ncbi:MAG: PrgI family protein [Candidatus Pacebacteria bacterium]|nr:PrgI family protein [Candidatus Paceibacterota bacterium]
MQVRVPQFIEHDPKLLGPLTLSQAIFVGAALFGTFLLYITMGESNFLLFCFLAALLFAIALFLAFYKVEGLSISTVIKNSVDYNMNTKLYLWKRKQIPVYLSLEKKKVEKEKSTKNAVVLKQREKMDNLRKKIDFDKQ